MQTSRFNLVSLVVIVVLLGLLSSTLHPCLSSSMLSANMTAVGTRGKDIYVAITAADIEREPLGLPSVWPRSIMPSTNALDISQMNFTNSTDFFYELYDGDHYGTTNHNPYVSGFDYSKLAGAGVPAHAGPGRLKPANNMWTIAKNVHTNFNDIIPVLVTRNLAAESLVTDLPTMSTRPLCFDEEWVDPFRNKGFVVVRKGGGIFNIKGRYAKVNILYGNQTFMTTIPGSQLPGLCYLTPNKEVTPTEATYQACATSNGKPRRMYEYWLRDQLELVSALLPALLIMGLVPGVHLILRASSDKNLSVLLSVAGFPYWLLLWLAATLYMCWPLSLLTHDSGSLLLALVVPLVLQIAGCFYLLVWERMTGNHNHEAFGPAFLLMLSAPLIALRCLVIVALFSLLFLVFP
jgi:hypothetical protein